MSLSPAQNVIVKANTLASLDMNTLPNNADGDYEIARLYNLPATGTWIVWLTDSTAADIGNAWVGTDIDGMSALNMQRLQLMLASSPSGVFDMSRADRRAGFENPFGASASNASRVAMRAAWKRQATRLEKLLSTGTGSDATPATMGFVGAVSPQEITNARNS